MPTLAEAQKAAQQGATQQARLMYQAILQEDETVEAAWLGLADVLSEKEEKRGCYQKVLKINPHNYAAKEGLRILDEEIPDWVQSLRNESEDLAPPLPISEPSPIPSKPTSAGRPITSKKKKKKKRKPKPSTSTENKVSGNMLYVVLGAVTILLIAIIIAVVVMLFIM